MRCRRCSTSTWRARRRAAAAAHRGHRRDALPARSSRRRSTKTSPGSASRGSSRCGGSPSISTNTARRSATLDAHAADLPGFESRAEIAHMVGDRDVRERWPRDPDGVPLYPGAARQMREEERQARIAARRSLCHPPRHEQGDGMGRAAALDRVRRRARGRDRRRSRPIPRPGATSSSAARRRRPAITSPSWSTTRCRASPMWCAARTCSGRPACTGCCRRCSICPAPVYHHHRLIPRRRRPQAFEIDAGHRPARACARRC